MAKTLIGVVDPFQREFGRKSKKDKERIILVLRKFMHSLRLILSSQDTGRIIRLVRPEANHPCQSCGFLPSIDDTPEFPGTIYGLLLTILSDNKLFACHGNQADWKKGKLDPEVVRICRGYESLVLFCGAATISAAKEAQRSIDKILEKK